ncbi:MAG: peptidoglycan DD-metalloendopeptidase family protein [Bacteroidales bacterium]|nr:peptidoglycan DD-metalloendopeptidase family protein [Bacteroidales bacterium]
MTFRRIIPAVLTVLLLGSLPLRAQDTSVQESRRAALRKEIAQLERQIKDNASRSSNALNELTLVRKQISTRRSLVEESQQEIRRLSDTIAVRQAEADRLRDRLDTMEEHFRRLVKNAYKNRDARLWYSYLLSSKDFGQASRRYAYLRDLSSQMNGEARKMQEVRAGLEEELVRLDSLKREAEEIRAAHEAELRDLRREELRSDQLVASLKKDKNLYQRQLNTKRKQVEALNREIERLIAQAIEEARRKEAAAQKNAGKQSSQTEKTRQAAPVDVKLSGEFASNKGKLPWPADGPVVERFGKHNHPVYTSLVMPANNGVNIGLSKGDPVKAVFDGEVRRVIVMPGYGRCVLVQHGTYFSFYCKLGEVDVKAGDPVKTGQVLGRVDTIDGQTQLHFEVWKEKKPENPETWLRPRH